MVKQLHLGIGGDPINGTRLIDAFDMVKDLPELRRNGSCRRNWRRCRRITWLKKLLIQDFKKPVVAYIAGRAAPKEKRMGHAGAIVMGNYGSAESKVSMFNKANIPVAKRPAEVPVFLADKIGELIRLN